MVLFYRQWEIAWFGAGGSSLKMTVVIPLTEVMK
jgi:hypothetical protein